MSRNELFNQLIKQMRPIVAKITAPKIEKRWEESKERKEKIRKKSKKRAKKDEENFAESGILMTLFGLTAIFLTAHDYSGLGEALKKLPGAILTELYRQIFWSKEKREAQDKKDATEHEVDCATEEIITEWLGALYFYAMEHGNSLTLAALDKFMLPYDYFAECHKKSKTDPWVYCSFDEDFEARQILSRFEAMYALKQLKEQSNGFPDEAKKYLALEGIAVHNQ